MNTLPNVNTRRGGKEPSHAGLTSNVSPEVQRPLAENSNVPAHFLFAVLMGYYYSVYHFGIDRSTKIKVMILAAPIIAHGIYDGILMSIQIDESLAGLCMILFLWFFNKLRKKGKERINSLIGD